MNRIRKRKTGKGLRALRGGPIRTVLVGTDFSPGASWAAARAARLPLDAGRIVIVHVLPAAERLGKLRKQAESAARRSLDEAGALAVKASRAAGNARVAVQPVLCFGKPHDEIVRTAQAERADLIVLGKHGRRVIRDLLLGSTADSVIRKGSVSVLVVNHKPAATYRRPLVALDLEANSRRTLEAARGLFDPGHVDGTILHAYSVPFTGFAALDISRRDLYAYRRDCRRDAFSKLRRFRDTAAPLPRSWRSVVREGDPRAVILREARRGRPDLVVVGAQGPRSELARAILGSVAGYVVRNADCDVLVVR